MAKQADGRGVQIPHELDEEMMTILRAFEGRPTMADETSEVVEGGSAGANPCPQAAPADVVLAHAAAAANSERNALWSEEWLYPVEAWSLVLGLDVPFWESGWRECVERDGSGEWPHYALLLNELERLRSARVLPSNDEGKIRRDDAVHVAYRLGFSLDLGSPAIDILMHRWGISPADIPLKSDPASMHHAPNAQAWPLIQAVAAVLAFFPDVAATAGHGNAAAAILHIIRERQILPPTYFDGEDDDNRAHTGIIDRMLALVRGSAPVNDSTK